MEEIKVLRKMAETTVISTANSKIKVFDKDEYVYINRKSFNYFEFLKFCVKMAISLKKIDLIFADNRAAIIPVLICKKLIKAKWAGYDARELYILNEVHHLRGKIGCLIEKILIRKFDLITCANSFRAAYMKKLYKLKKTPIVFENIRKLAVVDSKNNMFGEFEKSGADRKTINIIATSGCLLERKCDVLARAVCALGEGYRLYLVGASDENGRKSVEAIKAEYKTDNITLIDWLSKAALKKLMKNCDIGVVSYGCDTINNKYCASGKLYEYLFEGLPVVTTENPPLKDMCECFAIGISDDNFKLGIQTVSENLDSYKRNVEAYISTIDVDVYNQKVADEIMLTLKPKKLGDYSKLLFITSGYPTAGKQLYTFLDALVCALTDTGRKCTVIYPVSLSHFIRHNEKLPPKEWQRATQNGKLIRVLCPRILTFSSGRFLHPLRCALNYQQFRRAVYQTIRKYALDFDIAYGHFLQPSGFVASEIGLKYRVPSCVAYGENTSYNVDVFGIERSRQMIGDITACISVSSDNTRFLTVNRIIPKEKIATLPNAVDRTVFYPKSKAEMRKKYHISSDSFVVIFVGYFTEIKGSRRLSDALDMLGDVHSIFIGSGELKPTCKNIDFIGSIPHDEIPDLLSAADVFVLPTLAEGCCNAIVEALSCGLPVISSKKSFNDDILNDTCAIRIDTGKVSEIADAIRTLRDDEELRLRMGEEAIRISEEREITVRAERIMEWIRHCDRKL